MNGDDAVLALRNINMTFGTNKVLNGVSMELHAGQITALLGANGAGKSTLIKILSGVYLRTSGTIVHKGQEVTITTPSDAGKYGIQTVHQRVSESVVPGLTVAENLCFEEIVTGKLPLIASVNSLLPRAREIMSHLDLQWPDSLLRSDVYELGIADTQLLVLARALAQTPDVLVLDEPTSALSIAETERLFTVIRQLQDKGVAILYVSHHMSDIQRLADNIVVLRDGLVDSTQSQPFDMPAAIESMLGQSLDGTERRFHVNRGTDRVLTLENVQLLKKSKPFSLQLRSHEVTGIIGLIGAGKTELAQGIFGASTYFQGTMQFDGKPYHPANTRAAVKQGVYMVSEDRVNDAMLPGWSIGWTVSLPFMKDVCKRGIIDTNREMYQGRTLIEVFGVAAQHSGQVLDSLSGGNQQKVVVGRWMKPSTRVLLLDEPFRGVDIGARSEISTKARDMAEQGCCIVVLASDVDEILAVADRVIVLVHGNITLDDYVDNIDYDTIITSMSEVEA